MDDVVKMLGYFVIGVIFVGLSWELIKVLGSVLAALFSSTLGVILAFIVVITIIKKVL